MQILEVLSCYDIMTAFDYIGKDINISLMTQN